MGKGALFVIAAHANWQLLQCWPASIVLCMLDGLQNAYASQARCSHSYLPAGHPGSWYARAERRGLWHSLAAHGHPRELKWRSVLRTRHRLPAGSPQLRFAERCRLPVRLQICALVCRYSCASCTDGASSPAEKSLAKPDQGEHRDRSRLKRDSQQSQQRTPARPQCAQ